MQRVEGGFIYSASDLNNDLECRRLTWLEYRVALGELKRPESEAAVKLIADKGEAHELRYRDAQMAVYGDAMVTFDGRLENTRATMAQAEADTLAAMAGGAKLIYQATFFDGTFLGRTDFLRRIEKPSAKWAWSYEVIDTKLALAPKAYFLLQLCNYSEHLERLQGTAPEFAHLVLGSGIEASFRVDDYAAYYRHQKRQFLARAGAPAETYPAEIAHCNICRWSAACEQRREADDYLGLVAWMRQSQIDRLAGSAITTIGALGHAEDEQRPFGMTETTFATLRAQAELQHRQRVAFAAGLPREECYFYDLLDHEAGGGFEQLPPPDDGDVYFDMEGDPLYAPERGLEYLFGVYAPAEQQYQAFWATDAGKERAAFEQFMDYVVARRARYPNMHVYHYAPYETVALRRLMGEYGTREAELDDLLRGEVFVDLFAVVRQAVRISQPGYSIKKLEPFYGMVRHTDVRRGDDSIVMFEAWLAENDAAILADIEQYNHDDCYSTYLLHRWLQERRTEREQRLGRELPWRTPPDPAGDGDDDEITVDNLATQLLAGLPDLRTASELRHAEEHVRARWLLGHLLQYHRREAKPAWWKMFDRYQNADRLTEFDNDALGDLTLCEDVPPFKANPRDQNSVFTYAFPPQLHNILGAVHCPHTEQSAGTAIAIDDEHNRVQVKLAKTIVPKALKALIPAGPLPTKLQRKALHRVALAYQDGSLDTQFPAIRDLLLRTAPRFTGRGKGAIVQPPAITGEAMAALIADLDSSYLFVQGPPGSGKSTTGADAIVTLLAAGKRIGIVSRSHAAVHHLLHKVEARATERGVAFAGLYKHAQDDDAYVSRLPAPLIVSTAKYPDFTSRPHALAGGTPWLFTREDLFGSYDILVIDEAGLLSLGDAIACATAARNIVLLGDPLQLAQVSQGSHPVGTGDSVLAHLLGDHRTVPPDRGVFLDVSYRMHPDICTFISHAVYDDRLRAAPDTARNCVSSGGLSGAGLRYVPVEHSGNSRESAEEATRIADAIALLLQGEVTLSNAPTRPMQPRDILVVTPYNAQRTRIAQTLAARGLGAIAVGTVDKFQGQEAAVVIYSMATSSSEDMPRDMSFLFEKNRFNVAVSRAQCLSVVVCSPELLEVRCRKPDEMKLASLLCAYVERALPPA